MMNKRVLSVPVKIGILLCGLHTIVWLWFVSDLLIWTNSAQWQIEWAYPSYVDFPVSLIFEKLIWPFRNPDALQWLDQLDVFCVLPSALTDVDYIYPSLFYLFFGGLWYFMLPILVVKTAKFLEVKHRLLLAIVSLIYIIPIFASWTELGLFNYRLYEQKYIVHLIIAIVWLVLFLLLLISKRNLKVLVLLLYSPLAFYYLSQVIYSNYLWSLHRGLK